MNIQMVLLDYMVLYRTFTFTEELFGSMSWFSEEHAKMKGLVKHRVEQVQSLKRFWRK